MKTIRINIAIVAGIPESNTATTLIICITDIYTPITKRITTNAFYQSTTTIQIYAKKRLALVTTTIADTKKFRTATISIIWWVADCTIRTTDIATTTARFM